MIKNLENDLKHPLDGKALFKIIVSKGLCTGCAACVTVCQALGDKTIEYLKGESLPKIIRDEECRECRLCYTVCPQTGEEITSVEEDHYLGNYRKFEILQATDPEIQARAQDGGVVTGILTHLMEKHYIDGAIVSTAGNDWFPQPTIAQSIKELLASSGSRYSVSPNILFLENLLDLDVDHRYSGFNDENYAFVGTPCMVKAVQNMKKINLKIVRKVKLTIGLFCFENFNHEEITRRLEEKTGTKSLDWEKLNIKRRMLVYTKGKPEPFEIPLKELHDIVRGACNVCLDLTNLESDIAIGGLGAPRGYSSVLIRTKTGQEAVNLALRGKALEGIPEIGPERRNIYEKALRSISNTARRKITTNLDRIKNKSNISNTPSRRELM
ncbi:MAG: Coenzyme F420 hydrogenase/dehydrogenase, beta subunit C-terminal domain [Candidatus Heimdallarchaeota archaeon]|nr:Coenzyme F420 hydrogenase/dehydrogenase, beta subunit C-terminal domain [Candidatus Heimdallarchaeota archaeon]